jgi:hypothetical protein
MAEIPPNPPFQRGQGGFLEALFRGKCHLFQALTYELFFSLLPPFFKGSCEKIKYGDKITLLVVQGTVKIFRSKSAGDFISPMGSPDFR